MHLLVSPAAVPYVRHVRRAVADTTQQNSQQQTYTIAEYNAFMAAQQETDPAKLVMLLDDFVARYPESVLLVHAYPLFLRAHMQLQDFSKVIEYADKVADLGNKVELSAQLLALQDAAIAYNNLKSSDPNLATRARERALTALRLLPDMKKPEVSNREVFEAQKRKMAIYFQATAGAASIAMKNYPAAAESFNAIIALDSVPQAIGAQCNF
jgi:tetratricopeptide (TPR) repeat protein